MGRPTQLQINQKIGYLTIMAFEYKQKDAKRKLAKCKCVCDKVIYRRTDYLNECIILNKISSCGCQHPSKTHKGKDGYIWNGIGDISGNHISSIKHHAKTRNMEYAITKEYIWSLFLQQNKQCALTGLPLGFSHSIRVGGETTASLDRIDSKKGYIEGNVQWVHKDINKMKNNLDGQYFIEMCKMVASNN